MGNVCMLATNIDKFIIESFSFRWHRCTHVLLLHRSVVVRPTALTNKHQKKKRNPCWYICEKFTKLLEEKRVVSQEQKLGNSVSVVVLPNVPMCIDPPLSHSLPALPLWMREHYAMDKHIVIDCQTNLQLIENIHECLRIRMGREDVRQAQKYEIIRYHVNYDWHYTRIVIVNHVGLMCSSPVNHSPMLLQHTQDTKHTKSEENCDSSNFTIESTKQTRQHSRSQHCHAVDNNLLVASNIS